MSLGGGKLRLEAETEEEEGSNKEKKAKRLTKKKNKTFHIDIFRAWCKRCGICVGFCPEEVLAQDEIGYPYAKKPESCIGCKWCELRCPDFAITVLSEDLDQKLKEGLSDAEKEEEISPPGE
jgi:2-oxoglutarate ferredoxin oxidoreductase subunit delta